MDRQITLEAAQQGILEILKDECLTHEQQVSKLAKAAENLLPYPDGTPEEFYRMFDQGMICDMGEGHAPYSPRYILPDYEKFMREGSAFLRLAPPTDLYEAVTALLIMYRHVPSVTHFPVWLGYIDAMLEPFITDEAQARHIIKGFLISLDRTFGDSFVQANIGPKATRAGRIILDLVAELQNAIPNMALRYDPQVTPDDFARQAISTALVSANPAFAYEKAYEKDFGSIPFGIASCYNGLPVGGGAFTLARVRLNKIAENAQSEADFFQNVMPHAAEVMCRYMEGRIRFLVEDSAFFKSSFLVKEGFVKLDNFVGLFGVVGLAECVNHLMKLRGEGGTFGPDEAANQLGVKIMDSLKAQVESFTSAYSPVWHHKFMLHAQVGMDSDHGETTPGARIPIGQEIPLYDHLRQCGLYHGYFPSGVGDIFPFETTAKRNPQAILDIFKGAFKVGVRHIATYASDSDLIRVTGYLVKKSEVEACKAGKAAINDMSTGARLALDERHTLERKVRSL